MSCPYIFVLSVDRWLYKITETSLLIAIKFNVNYIWDGGKVASGFGADWIKTLVSMATVSSHRTIMANTIFHVFSVVLIRSCSYLHVMRMNIKA